MEYIEFIGNTFEKMYKYKHRIVNEVSYHVRNEPFNRERIRNQISK